MINFEDLEPGRINAKPRDLQMMSVEELENYIAVLEAEIMRADAIIAKKNTHKEGIAALFGQSGD